MSDITYGTVTYAICFLCPKNAFLVQGGMYLYRLQSYVFIHRSKVCHLETFFQSAMGHWTTAQGCYTSM